MHHFVGFCFPLWLFPVRVAYRVVQKVPRNATDLIGVDHLDSLVHFRRRNSATVDTAATAGTEQQQEQSNKQQNIRQEKQEKQQTGKAADTKNKSWTANKMKNTEGVKNTN